MPLVNVSSSVELIQHGVLFFECLRLKTMSPVNYSERREASKGGKVAKDVEICIPEGEKPELYTKEHERVLGDSKKSWSLYEDGYDEDGQRIYDPDFGKSCHQCR